MTTPKPVLRLTKKTDGGSSKKKKFVSKNKVKEMIEKYEQNALEQESSETSGVAHQRADVCTPKLTSIGLTGFLFGKGKTIDNNIERPFWVQTKSEDLGNLCYAEVKGDKGAKGAKCVPIKGVKGGKGW